MRAHFADDEVVDIVADSNHACIKLYKVGDVVRYTKPSCIKTSWPIKAREETMLLRGTEAIRREWVNDLTQWLGEWYNSFPEETQNHHWGLYRILFEGWGLMELHQIENRLREILKWAHTVK